MKTIRDRPRKPFPFHFLNSSIFQNNCILGTDSDREQADTRCSKTKNSPKQHSPISLIKQTTSTCFNQIIKSYIRRRMVSFLESWIKLEYFQCLGGVIFSAQLSFICLLILVTHYLRFRSEIQLYFSFFLQKREHRQFNRNVSFTNSLNDCQGVNYFHFNDI